MAVPFETKQENIYSLLVSGIPSGTVVKKLPVKAGDMGSVPELGEPPGEGNCHPLQYFCLGNPMDRGAWGTIVHGVQKELDMT